VDSRQFVAGPAAEGGEPEPMQAEGAAAPTPAEDDPVVKAVSEAVGVQPDRAQRLIEALDIIGDRIDQVRRVGVFQGEKGPHGAVTRGEFHYVIDRVAGSQRRRDDRRDDRRGGGDRGGRGGGDRGRGGGGGGGGGFGGDRGPPKPRGLGSLKFSDAKPDAKSDGDDRPGRGEMPRAGIGWQLTAAPRDFSAGGGRGPGRGPGRGRGPGGPGGDRPRRDDRGRGPGGPGGPGGDRPRRDDRGPRGFGGGGPGGGGGGPRGPRPDRPQQLGAPGEGMSQQQAQPQQPRLGPDGQPLPPRSKRPRKPIGPDANGNGPDGKPWDPERRAQRQAERAAQPGAPSTPMNEAVTAPVEAGTSNTGQTPTE
jgi:hypothetical protein